MRNRLLGCLPLLARILILAVALRLARRRRPAPVEPWVEDDDGWAVGV